MWVTQTYLGVVEPNAQLFVYYLYENYNADQRSFTESVRKELEDLGVIYGDSVSFLFPNKRFTTEIEGQVRTFQQFWYSLGKKLPSILLSTKPLSQFDMTDGNYYVLEFASRDPKGVAEAVYRLRQLINEQLSFDFANQTPAREASFWEEMFAALELKAGWGPVKIDLRKAAAALSNRNYELFKRKKAEKR